MLQQKDSVDLVKFSLRYLDEEKAPFWRIHLMGFLTKQFRIFTSVLGKQCKMCSRFQILISLRTLQVNIGPNKKSPCGGFSNFIPNGQVITRQILTRC